MKQVVYNISLFIAAVFLAFAACNKPDIAEPEDDKDTGLKDTTEVEAPDTTEKADTIIKPEEPVVPAGTYSINISFDSTNGASDGWDSQWVPGDAINVFTIPGSRHDDAERWTNHGKFTFDHTSDDTFVGDLNGSLDSDVKYLWHAVYPYTVDFTDPSGLEKPHEDQIVTIGHTFGSYLTQNGNNSKEHLKGPTFPMYDAATTIGDEVPEFKMHQMASVIELNVKNGTAKPLVVTDIKLAHSEEALAGTFAVDFGWVTGGFGSSNLFRSPITSTASTLKVVGGSPIPVNSSAKFYLPIMPNKFAAGSEWIVTVNDYKKSVALTEDESIYSGIIKEFDFTVVDPATIGLLSPAADAQYDLVSTDRIEFAWDSETGADEYSILMSASEDMSDYRTIHAKGKSLSMSAETLDYYAHELGLDFEESGDVYWTVIVKGDYRLNSAVRRISVKRRAMVAYEDRIAPSITIPVAILIENPVYYGSIEEYRGKRLTEIKHEGWGYKWNDPKVQMMEYERDMEASSHGVVQYEVVKIIEADRFFSYYSHSVGGEREYLDVDTLVNHYFRYNPVDPNDNRKWIDKLASYDYVGMMKYYGFDKMTDNGEINEVWVYTHPASGMNESRLIGKGAFWCNSMGIDVPEATNTELCCVMFCNYERTTDLAMHSFGHRFESIMSQVYERKGGFEGWNYATKDDVNELTNWEKYSAHSMEYKKYKPGYAHIGCCHFPANADQDYGYYNKDYVMTYADTWYDYPYIREDDSVARRINNSEWKDAGGDQWGYMKWYFGHIPHFKGICPRDGHLNNWWHYLVDYNEAIRLEEQMQADM